MLQSETQTIGLDTTSVYGGQGTESVGYNGGDFVVHRGFSVWRIAQRMPGCTPQQLDSAVQANLPVREKVRSECPDTLSIPGLPGRKPYESDNRIIDFGSDFFKGNPLIHPELPPRNQGVSATPLPYALSNDNLVTIGLLTCMLMLIFVVNKTRRQLRQQTKDFFVAPRQHNGLFAVETNIEGWAHVFTVFQLSLMGALSMFAFSQYELNIFLGQISPRWLLGVYLASFLSFFIVKRVLTRFTNWVFFTPFQQQVWSEINSYMFTIECIIFFPLLLTFVYFRTPFIKTCIVFLIMLILVKLLLAFKARQIFFPKFYGFLHLFAYLCALEIMPLLALWKSLDIVTENLIVK